jgi:uncharacterized protein YjbI with pentapeptide repeats
MAMYKHNLNGRAIMIEPQEVNKDELKLALQTFIKTFWGQYSLFGMHHINNSKFGPNVSLYLKKEFNTNDLSGMDLHNMDFRFANLEHLKFDGSDISGANFAGASLISCSLEKVVTNRKTNFKSSCLVNAKFTGSQLSNVNFSKALAHFANFDRCKINMANFNEADCTQMSLSYAEVNNCDFENSNLTGCKVNHSTLSRLKLRHALLTDSDFRQCDIKVKSQSTSSFFSDTVHYSLVNVSLCAAPFLGPAMAANYPTSSTKECVITNKPTVIFSEASDVHNLQLDNYDYDNQSLQQKGAIIKPK